MYDFRGDMDEVKIYDFALLPDSIAAESGHVITGIFNPPVVLPLTWNIYSTPATNKITIEITDAESDFQFSGCPVSISDVNGRQEWKGTFGQAKTRTIDISTLCPGVHSIRLEKANHVWIKDFIIIH